LRKRKKECYENIKGVESEESRKRLKTELSRVSKDLKKETRKVINAYKTHQVKEIERLEPDDARRMWKELKALGVD
jgi:hypothetical protein